MPIDQRNKLEEEPFDYQSTKDCIRVFHHHKMVTILRGKAMLKLDKQLENAKTSKEVQLLLAKITGHYKHGNERR
ncbi:MULTISPECIES: hypothetical protein [unclassified Fusibacter]|uniref:hypothetical protein n=1 Tax=unclassified Fusibacter TaxID=2624464 RepID=UPI001010382A|nr:MULTISPECIES: hypothetical protein [unclassified Fusibacter]NPE20452.1 hypothetical protein [Fusibacter sp. A1]RXV63658.1 hypothetical protein DWB64_01385 [Fusibacter sp. A1]